jgi:hypothetical protein
MQIGARRNELTRRAHEQLRGQRVSTRWPKRIASVYPQPHLPSPQVVPNRAGALADITAPRNGILINYSAIR